MASLDTVFLALLKHTAIGYTFQHELIAEYLTAKKILNTIRSSQSLSLLAEFQTSYHEDMFIAQEISSDSSLFRLFDQLYREATSEILIVNIVGILSKVKNHKESTYIESLLRFILGNPKVCYLYETAVMSRVLHKKSRIDETIQSLGKEEDISRLRKELLNGEDPVAAFFCLKKLALYEDTTALSRENAKRLGVNYYDFLTQGD